MQFKAWNLILYANAELQTNREQITKKIAILFKTTTITTC